MSNGNWPIVFAGLAIAAAVSGWSGAANARQNTVQAPFTEVQATIGRAEYARSWRL